jgi:hypothetical protein
MGKIYVLGREGHTLVEWQVQPVEGDARLLEAEALFGAKLASGYAAFQVDGGLDTAEKIETFQPEAQRIILVPPLVGG